MRVEAHSRQPVEAKDEAASEEILEVVRNLVGEREGDRSDARSGSPRGSVRERMHGRRRDQPWGTRMNGNGQDYLDDQDRPYEVAAAPPGVVVKRR